LLAPIGGLYCLPVSETLTVVRIATLRLFLYDNMHLPCCAPCGAREWRTNDPPNKKSDHVRRERVSERRGKRASSTRERSASEVPILLRQLRDWYLTAHEHRLR
jgi:hypothetical protein